MSKVTVAQALVAELAGDPVALDELRGLLRTAEADRVLTTNEAAERLGVHPTTLTRAANEGRVRGAFKIGTRNWRFRLAELELLPPEPTAIGPAGPGRGRRPVESPAAASIRAARSAAA